MLFHIKEVTMANFTKRTIKYLAICKDIKIIKNILKSSNNNIIKSICNASINAANGEIIISDSNKRLFHSYQSSFQILNSRSISISLKRSYIMSNKQKVLTLIPLLLTSVLSTIGTSFCIENVNIQKVRSHEQNRVRPTERKENSCL